MSEILVSDITTKEVNGTGIFDNLMSASSTLLEHEFKAGRLTGTDYAKVYLGAMEGTIAQSIGFALGKQAADKQADLLTQQILTETEQTLLVAAQVTKITAEVSLIGKQELKIDQDILVAKQEVLFSIAKVEQMQYQANLTAVQAAKVAEEIKLVAYQADNMVQEILLSKAKVEQMGEQIFLTQAQVKKTEQDVINSTVQATVLIRQSEKLEQEVLVAQQQVLNMTATVAKTNEEVTLIQGQVAKLTADTSLTTQKQLSEVQQTAQIIQQTDLLSKKVLSEVTQELKLSADVTYIGLQGTKVTQDTSLGIQQEKNLFTEETKIDEEILLLKGKILNEVKQGVILDNAATKIAAEKALLDEKKWTEQAQTNDTVNGGLVTGVVGKQKTLYGRQADGFLRDAEQKLSKIMTDTWSVRKSSDPNGTFVADNNLNDASIASVIATAKTGIGA